MVPVGLADRALRPVCVPELSSLHLGVCGVPVGYAHVHTYRDRLQSFQPMPFQDGHSLFELSHIIASGEQGPGELPDVFCRDEGRFVGDHPVEHSEDDLTESGSWICGVALRTNTLYNAVYV